MSTNYSSILHAYPEKISIEQLYRICHFSKRKCKWLLENGYIPCEDRGTKTWRFVIRTVDVVEYLTLMETDPSKAPPKGLFNAAPAWEKATPPLERVSLTEIRQFLQERWSEQPDALYEEDVAKLVGYSRNTIHKWIVNRRLKYVPVLNEVVIPKNWLIEYFAIIMKKHCSRESATQRTLTEELLRRKSRE